jgi:tryptophan synthase alpha chain
MSRIETRFRELQEQGRAALVPFVTAGDPHPDITVPLMHAMVEAGADIIELGVPFSDPMADGPVIQRASERALEHHIGMRDVLQMVSRFRQDDGETPVVLMGYLNPIEVMGYELFAEKAGNAGVDGVLTVDLPPEEADEMLQALRPQQIDPIFLIAPTTTAERIRGICNAASGFVYYVSVKGITGASHLAIDEVSEKVAGIRTATDLPVGVGFGIKDADSARAVAQVADAVIVGSAIVSRIEQLVDRQDAIAPELVSFLSTLRQAMDNR